MDDHYNHPDDDTSAITDLIVGRRIVTAARDDSDHGTITLDDGTRLQFESGEGGCSCGAGDYDLEFFIGQDELPDNIITAVHFEDSPDGDDEDGDGTYKVFVVAEDRRLRVAEFEGSDGNGYYGTGYTIKIKRPDE